jgi:hypothetical protein
MNDDEHDRKEECKKRERRGSELDYSFAENFQTEKFIDRQ